VLVVADAAECREPEVRVEVTILSLNGHNRASCSQMDVDKQILPSQIEKAFSHRSWAQAVGSNREMAP